MNVKELIDYAGVDALDEIFPETEPLGFMPTIGQY